MTGDIFFEMVLPRIVGGRISEVRRQRRRLGKAGASSRTPKKFRDGVRKFYQ
jgi:hypothetical protein